MARGNSRLSGFDHSSGSDVMQKIVINTCYGGFGLSEEAEEYLNNIDPLGSWEDPYSFSRDHVALIKVVEELGSYVASGSFASLKIVEIPDGVEWQIEEYDGVEWVAEKHRTWD